MDAQAGDAGSAPALLELRNLCTSFSTPQGTVPAVDGVSLSVYPGQTLAVVGESGSGKSVTALSVLRLFNRGDSARATGEILWRERDGSRTDLALLPEPELRRLRGREIAVIFQDPGASLDPVYSVGEHLRETLRRHRPQEDAQALAVELLRDVGIADPQRRVDAYAHQLSGGMRQRVMIAIALACQPRLLIADEPTTALDVTIQQQIVRLLADLQQKYGMALLFITHDLGLVAEIADRVAVMYAGQVVETGSVEAVLRAPAHPYTRALLDCRPHRTYRDDGPDDRWLAPIPGMPPRPGTSGPGCRFAPRCSVREAACTAGAVPLHPVAGEERQVRCVLARGGA